MPKPACHLPRAVPQVMVSSTFTDLVAHRAALIEAINGHGLHPKVMEHDSAKLADVIDSSLQMVEDSAAYILLVSQKYGQIPDCPKRNPDRLSITELEFNRAQKLSRPTLLFVMGDDHLVKKANIESDPEKEKKLGAFRERAKKASQGSSVDRVYAVFNSLEEFKEKIGPSLVELGGHFSSLRDVSLDDKAFVVNDFCYTPIPAPPAFYAEPDYIGRHTFIGRKAQLQVLNDWAKSSDPASILLFEAIGGNGKSMLTWEWAKDEKRCYATVVREWEGRFWYSFYERGAVMRDFCQHALAYMTHQPLEAFSKRSTADMRVDLLVLLHKRPWLFILDGLERVLVAYHRIDAPEVPDEEVNRPTDKILDRDPCDAIRDEDTDLLRALAAAAPSKILISSRLVPRVFLNQAGIPIPGVKPLVLPGMDENSAEELLRSCDVRGTSQDIRYYLTNYCGNHPLVIGVLAGLINSPGPHRGDFDAWVADPEYGAKLNLASLDLIQSRNHILRAALEALEPTSRQLLSTLALLSDAVDYETVVAISPHLSLGKLRDTIEDLEDRGLLQYDSRTRRYDLHPVVRGVAAGGMIPEDKERYGQRVIDYYSSQPHDPYAQATTMEDVKNGLNIIRTLLKLGHFQQAVNAYYGDLSYALIVNIEAYEETLALLRPFFPSGWNTLPKEINAKDAPYLANDAAIALSGCGELKKALETYGAALRYHLEVRDWKNVVVLLSNISRRLLAQNMLAKSLLVDALALEIATIHDDNEYIFLGRVRLFEGQSQLGNWQEARTTWSKLDPMGRHWTRATLRKGDAEYFFAQFQFWQGGLQEQHLEAAAFLAKQDNNRRCLRDLHRLRGAWQLEQGEWKQAGASFCEAVTMARERRLVDAISETGHALVKYQTSQLTDEDARSEANRLAQLREPAHLYLAKLWLALKDANQAKHHLLAAYRWAWADGEPFVNRYELSKTAELLQQMNIPAPKLLSYDVEKDTPFFWEGEVRTALDKLRVEK